MQQYLPLAVLKLATSRPSSFVASVATVLTACGIETASRIADDPHLLRTLQQYLPLAVLKPIRYSLVSLAFVVATVLTACGIETSYQKENQLEKNVATVLTACGIETFYHAEHFTFCVFNTLQQYLPLAVLKQSYSWTKRLAIDRVATVLTACGIETEVTIGGTTKFFRLQQYLPLAVLKLGGRRSFYYTVWLQQYLPLAVLKPIYYCYFDNRTRFQLQQYLPLAVLKLYRNDYVSDRQYICCNSTYRLRY